jgi:putative endopeptidase
MMIGLLNLGVSISLAFAGTTAVPVAKGLVPSSEIPVRRDFPLNDSVSACDNFHDYVCSSVEASFKLREDRSRHTFAFNDSAERLLLEKRKFFKNINKEKKLSERGRGLKNNYLSCMNQTAGVKEEKTWLFAFQKEIEGIKDVEAFQRYQIQNLVAGKPSLVEVGETENSEDPNVYDLYVGVKFMNLPDHSYYDNVELVAAYREIVIDFFKIISPGLERKLAEQRADGIINLEKEFIKTYPKPEVRRQRWREKRAVGQKDFLATYGNIGLAPLLKMVPEKTMVRLTIPEAMKYFNDILVPDKLEVIKDFALYTEGMKNMDDAFPGFFDKAFAFRHKYFGGPEKRPVREERCTMAVMNAYAKELDEILLPRLFPNFQEAKFKMVVEKVRQAIVKGMEQNQWLSAEAKQEAKEKMANARLQLVRPQNEREWDFHPNVKYSATNRIKNTELLLEAEFRKMLQVIPEPVNNDKWVMGPLEINAYYDSSANKFVMPLGILQFPFFDASGGEIENLGSVGAVVGHELGHGVDDMGSRFDQKGRLRQWMTMKDLAEFSKRSSKLVDQYQKLGHNGSFTLGENVADLVGVTFAYSAAFPSGEASVEDKQKFFISYARLWCGVVRPQFEEKQLKTDPHALGWARINEPLKHQKGFVEAFRCKAGDKMFLAEKDRVSIW